MQSNIWMYLFFALLAIAIIVIAYQDMRRADQPLEYYKDKCDEIERSYIELAKSHSYVLETIMKNDIDMQQYWPEAGPASSELVDRSRTATVKLDQSLDQGQSQARTAALAPDEAVEDVRLDVKGDATPGIRNLQSDLTGPLARSDADRAAGRGLANGIFHQMVEDLTQTFDVAPDQANVLITRRGEVEAR